MESAKAAPLLSAVSPTQFPSLVFRNSPTALVFEATTGVPLARDSSAAKQKVSIGPGAIEISADAIICAKRFLLATYPQKVTGMSLDES